MTQKQPAIQGHLCRPTTKTSARRGYQRVVSNVDAGGVAGSVNGNGTLVNQTQVAHVARLQSTSSSVVNPGIDVPWDTMILNPDGWWSSGSNTKITVDRDGLYLIVVQLQFLGAASGKTYGWIVTKNVGAVQIGPGQTMYSVGASSGMEWSASFVTQLSAGDYIVVHASSNDASGALVGSATATEFSATWIGS